jgi:type IV pilus assembly protein PilC
MKIELPEKNRQDQQVSIRTNSAGSPKRLSLKKKISFYEELSGLIEAGVGLSSALELMEEGREGRSKTWLRELRMDMVGGKSLADSMLNRNLFSRFEIESIRASEQAGKLESVLKSNLSYFIYVQRLNKTILGAISYPVFLVLVAIGVVTFMLRVVVPMFSDVYKQMNNELPEITLLLLDVSLWIEDYGKFLVLVFFMTLLAGGMAWRMTEVRVSIEQVIIKIPVLGKFYKNKLKTEQIGLIKTLTEAFVPIYPALILAAKSSTSYWMKDELMSCAQRIEKGEKLADVFKALSIYSPSELLIIRLGEETNTLHRAFGKIAKNTTTALEEDANLLGKTLEPALIGLVTVFIGVILVALYLPLFSMSA